MRVGAIGGGGRCTTAAVAAENKKARKNCESMRAT